MDANRVKRRMTCFAGINVDTVLETLFRQLALMENICAVSR